MLSVGAGWWVGGGGVVWIFFSRISFLFFPLPLSLGDGLI